MVVGEVVSVVPIVFVGMEVAVNIEGAGEVDATGVFVPVISAVDEDEG